MNQLNEVQWKYSKELNEINKFKLWTLHISLSVYISWDIKDKLQQSSLK